MVRYATFALGFAAGWVARGTTDSSRSAALALLVALLAGLDRLKRAIAIERDHIEDLVAEARARADAVNEHRGASSARKKTVRIDGVAA